MANGRVEAFKKDIQAGEIKQASEDFEAYFISYMLKVMRETVPRGLMTNNRMGEVFQSFYDETIGKESAKRGGLGLGENAAGGFFQHSHIRISDLIMYPYKALLMNLALDVMASNLGERASFSSYNGL